VIQAVALFLLAMAGLAIWARWRKARGPKAPPRLAAPALCARCGRLVAVGRRCPCEGGGGPAQG
jgi:hypothetical protein